MRTPTLTLLALSPVLFTLACKADEEDTDPSEADTDTDTDSDTDADTDADSDADTDADTDSDTDTDTGMPAGPMASIAFVEDAGENRWTALSAADLQGFENAAECSLGLSICRDQLAVGGSFVEVSGDFDIVAAQPTQLADLVIGGVAALPPLPNSFAYEGFFGTPPTGPLDTSWSMGFGWPAYAGTGLIPVLDPIVRTAPPDDVFTTGGGETIPFSWAPGTAGPAGVELAVTATDPGGTLVRRVYALDDATGTFDLDIDSLGLNGSNSRLDFELSRVQYGSDMAGNNPIQWSSRSIDQSTAWFLGTRDALAVPSDCIAAELATPIGPGRYLGERITNDLDPGDGGCVGFATPGPEAILPVSIPADTLAVFRYETLGGFGKSYLVSDCADAGTCVTGADSTFSFDGVAELTYLNSDPDPIDLFLVLDGNVDEQYFHLDVEYGVGGLTPAFLGDTCADVANATVISEDTVVTGSLTGQAADVDPIPGGCGFNAYDGADQLFQVELEPGERMIAKATGPVGLHSRTTCDDDTTCTGSVFPGNPLSLVNDTAATVTHFVAADSYAVYTPPQSYVVDVGVFVPQAVVPEDTCATLANAPLFETGEHHLEGDLGASVNDLDLDLPGPSCTGFASAGNEGVVQVRLQPGETLVADYVRLGGDGVIYVLEDCTDTTTAVACDDNTFFAPGADAPEHLEVTNETAAAVDWTLVLDSFASGPSEPFYLDLVID